MTWVLVVWTTFQPKGMDFKHTYMNIRPQWQVFVQYCGTSTFSVNHGDMKLSYNIFSQTIGPSRSVLSILRWLVEPLQSLELRFSQEWFMGEPSVWKCEGWSSGGPMQTMYCSTTELWHDLLPKHNDAFSLILLPCWPTRWPSLNSLVKRITNKKCVEISSCSYADFNH